MSGLSRRSVLASLLGLAASSCGSGSTPPRPPPDTPSPTPSPSPTPTPTGEPEEYTAFGAEMPVDVSGHSADIMEPFISADGETLYFNNRNSPPGETDLFRASRQGDGFASLGRIPGANSDIALDAVASLDDDGNFYFVTTRSYDADLKTIYSGVLTEEGAAQVAPVEGISRNQPGQVNFDAEISRDGRTLWFVDGQFSPGQDVPDSASIAVAERGPEGFVRRQDSETMLAAVNTGGLNYAPCTSRDGLELFFTRLVDLANPQFTIHRAVRSGIDAPFLAPQKIASISGYAEAPTLSDDGRTLYYHKLIDGRFRLFKVQR